MTTHIKLSRFCSAAEGPLVLVRSDGLASPTDEPTIPRLARCVKPKNPVDPCSALIDPISVPYRSEP